MLFKDKKEFDDELYGYSIIYDLIDFDKNLFRKYISTVPDMSKDENKSFWGSYDNIRLSQIINLAYKFNLAFDEELKDLLNKLELSGQYHWNLQINLIKSILNIIVGLWISIIMITQSLILIGF